ncbi:MAG: IS1634 family transposase [Planctomycetes bacterium]|nr:IS1634 family transposase [Planctomycetota bacterium]
MFVDSCTYEANGKTYTRHLLRESFREHGKVRHRTLANLSKASDDEIQAIKLALKNKHQLEQLGNIDQDIDVKQGLSVGAVVTLWQLAQRIGLVKALGSSPNARRALWQVFARVIDQGSRLSAVRLATSHAACDVLALDTFNEDDLYQNLDWLAENQARIEDQLFSSRYGQQKPELYLYDVTSSYFEGVCNELAAFGYNRDGKRGKMQVVYGMLCDPAGVPVSISAFDGNTTDTKTFGLQIHKVAHRFGGAAVTLVGDRGMIKGPQIEQLQAEKDHEFHYITAITKPQIETLLKQGVVQMELFDEQVAEVTTDNGLRYVLRRNPTRAAEMIETRQSKYAALEQLVKEQNTYLAEHPRASVAVAQRKVEAKWKKLRLPAVDVKVDGPKADDVKADGRSLLLSKQQEAWEESAKLDGCYCLKTDLLKETASKEVIHDRYKDLSQVEWAFRTSKTVHLEARPIYVRLATRTRGHLFVLMLAYLLVQELSRCWRSLDITVEEGLDELKTLCTTQVVVKGKSLLHNVPQPRDSVARLLRAAQVELPRKLASRGVHVSTRKKLVEERKTA